MTIKERFQKSKLNLKTVAAELKTSPANLYKALDGDKEQSGLAKKLIKRIEKEEKALGIELPGETGGGAE